MLLVDRIKVVNGRNSFQVIIEEYLFPNSLPSHAVHKSIKRTDRKQPYTDWSRLIA